MPDSANISGIGPLQGAGNKPKVPASQVTDGADFKKFLMDNLNRVNEMQAEADDLVHDMAVGKEQDINKVMGAVEKADVAFQTLMAVRNKLVESYQEILRMRV